MTSQEGTPFSAVAEVHPAMVDPEDAKGITVPLCMLASGDEDMDAVKKFEANLKVKNFVDHYPSQVHGKSSRGTRRYMMFSNACRLDGRAW